MTPEQRTRLRRYAALLCLGLTAGLYVAQNSPPLSFGWWLPRLIARELALLTVLLALGTAWLSIRAFQSRIAKGVCVAMALLYGFGASLPLFGVLPLFSRLGLRFSITEYVFSVSRPSGIREEHDVGLASDRPELRVDVYRPAQPPAVPSPGVVVLHGGSFQFGDKGDVPQVSRALAAAGFAVFDLRYRLAPQHPFPAAVQDVLCAVGRLAEPAARERFFVDGKRIALLGRSAGGTLALTAAYAAAAQAAVPSGQAGLPALRAGCAVIDVVPKAVVGIYPWTDLRAVHEQPPSIDPLDSPDKMRAYLGGTPAQLPGPYAHASPLFYAGLSGLPGGTLPPTLLIHGEGDAMVPSAHSERLADALRRAGYTPQTLFIPLAEHGFDFRPGGAGEQLERALVLRFLHSAL